MGQLRRSQQFAAKGGKRSYSRYEFFNNIQSQMCEWEVQWEFGPPEAPHHGGLYERQLRTIKKALDGLSDLSLRTPSDDDF